MCKKLAIQTAAKIAKLGHFNTWHRLNAQAANLMCVYRYFIAHNEPFTTEYLESKYCQELNDTLKLYGLQPSNKMPFQFLQRFAIIRCKYATPHTHTQSSVCVHSLRFASVHEQPTFVNCKSNYHAQYSNTTHCY